MMGIIRKVSFLCLFVLFAFSVAKASEQHGEHNTKEHAAEHDSEHESKKKYNPTEVIMHHVADAHNWHLFDKVNKKTGKTKHISIPLPIIIFYKGQIDMFMSSEFHEGHAPIGRFKTKYPFHKEDYSYVLYHDKIYISEDGELNFDAHHHPTNVQPLDFSITKNVASMMLSVVLILGLFIPMARRYQKKGLVPGGMQGFLEPIVMFVVEDIAKPNIGEKNYKRFLPYLLTVFFFIWINNLLGLIPTGANLTGNIAVTMTLAVFTLIVTNISGKKTYWGHIFAPPVPKWLWPIMIPVELIGVLSKPFALMIRLFANITAGHIIILSLISLIFIFKNAAMGFVSVPMVLFMDMLELLVAILQAYIFTLLSALFIGLAVQEHH